MRLSDLTKRPFLATLKLRCKMHPFCALLRTQCTKIVHLLCTTVAKCTLFHRALRQGTFIVHWRNALHCDVAGYNIFIAPWTPIVAGISLHRVLLVPLLPLWLSMLSYRCVLLYTFRTWDVLLSYCHLLKRPLVRFTPQIFTNELIFVPSSDALWVTACPLLCRVECTGQLVHLAY